MAGMEYWSACELAGQIRAGKVTSLAAVEFFIDRIERLDAGRTNNVVVKTYESARRRAKEADAALAKGESWGVLHGMPMTVKESYAIVGVQTTCGMSRFMEPEPFKPAVNAAVVHRVLGQGALIIGKTNLPELAADMQSYNSIYGTTRSAWNMDHTPGGSSGGGAGAVACGLTPVEIGSDIEAASASQPTSAASAGTSPARASSTSSAWCRRTRCLSTRRPLPWLAPWLETAETSLSC